MRSDADNIKKKTEELNNRLKEFKSLLSQASNEASQLNNESVEAEGSNPHDRIAFSEPAERNEVLSLKCLASNVIKNTKNCEN